MRQNKKRFIRKFYFSNTSTLVLPFFFLTLSLIIFLQQFHSLSIKRYILENNYIEALMIYGLFISGVIVLFILCRNLIKKTIAPSSLEGVIPIIISEYDPNKKIIRRKEQQEKLKDFFDKAFAQRKYAFLVGKSGSGKSLLVSEYVFYEKNVTRFTASDYSIQNDLEGKLDEIVKECNKRMTRYCIIFDQFERALVNKKVFGYITHFLKESKNSPIFVVFVCMNNDYDRIIEELEFSTIKETEEG